MGDGVELLSEAIGALGRVDVGSLTEAELHELVVAVQRQRARLGGVAAVLLERWEASATWRADGSMSAPARLARETGVSMRTARHELFRAHKAASMPVTMAAVDEGRLSLDHVDLFGGANGGGRQDAFAHDEAFLVETCERLRYPEARRVVAYWCRRVDADHAEREGRRRVAAAHLHASTTLDDMVVVDGLLDPIGGAIVTAELDRLERELYLADQQSGAERTTSQRRAAALVEMATRSASTPGHARRPKPLFTVLLGDTSFEQMCELANGTVLAPGVLMPWLSQAQLERVLFDGPSTVISVSRRRTFTGAVRRAIEVRDRHCRHRSGCDVPADRCDVDHVTPWSVTRRTSQFGGRIECPPHNRDPVLHDHDAEPLPERPVGRLDELRALVRWRIAHGLYDDWPYPPTASEAHDRDAPDRSAAA